jgi:DNA-binding MarR family transcriptional regulator
MNGTPSSVKASLDDGAVRRAVRSTEPPATDRTSALLVTPASARARRDLGPLGWTVLEALVLSAEDDGHGRLIARASLRSLGAELGLDKDTVGRALNRLAQAGLAKRTVEDGSPSYRVTPVAGMFPIETPTPFLTRPHPSDSDRHRPLYEDSAGASRPRPEDGVTVGTRQRQTDDQVGAPNDNGQLSFLDVLDANDPSTPSALPAAVEDRRIGDDREHHWARAVLSAVREGDPLAYGPERLRQARSTYAADLRRVERGQNAPNRRLDRHNGDTSAIGRQSANTGEGGELSAMVAELDEAIDALQPSPVQRATLGPSAQARSRESDVLSRPPLHGDHGYDLGLGR